MVPSEDVRKSLVKEIKKCLSYIKTYGDEWSFEMEDGVFSEELEKLINDVTGGEELDLENAKECWDVLTVTWDRLVF